MREWNPIGLFRGFGRGQNEVNEQSKDKDDEDDQAGMVPGLFIACQWHLQIGRVV